MSNRSRRDFLKLSVIGAAGSRPLLRATPRHIPLGATEERFLEAVVAGRLGQVREFLNENPSLLSSRDSDRRTAFTLAHLHNHPEIGLLLRERGYQPDAHEAALAQDWDRFSQLTQENPEVANAGHPLGGTTMLAAALGGAGSELWRVYAAAGAPNLYPEGSSGLSPLQAALRYPDLPTAELTAATLIANAADPNPPTRGDLPPLHIAAERGSEELVEMLVRLGARVSAKDQSGRTAMGAATDSGQPATRQLLAAHEEIPRTHSTSRTAYDVHGRPYRSPEMGGIPVLERSRVVGVSHGDLTAVEQALSREPRLAHSVATTSEICVEACAHTGRRPIVEYLLEKGAPYSLPTAVMMGDRSRVRELLDEDPLRIHERGAHDFALLWYPIIGHSGKGMLELLLDRGARVEEQHQLGTTALHWAAMRGDLKTVELLVEAGADLNRRGRKFRAEGESPLQVALRSGQDEVARLLRGRGAV